MSEENKGNYKFAEKVKVKVSEDKKWITHVLPSEGVFITKSIKYYQKILERHLNTDVPEVKKDDV